jgi:cell division protein FtsA
MMDPIVVLDIGTASIRVLAGEETDDGAMRVTGWARCPSDGMRKGVCQHIENLAAAVQNALRQAEDMAELDIQSVVLPISGPGVYSQPYSCELTVNGRITHDHIRQILSTAVKTPHPPSTELLHNVPQDFRLDNLPGINPVGLDGSVLGLDGLLIYGFRSQMRNLFRVVNGLKREVQQPVYSGLASASACLDADQKRQGVLLIDIGDGIVDFLAYTNSQLSDAGVVPVGGRQVTNDIAHAFRLHPDTAESLKIDHGDAIVNATQRNQRIELPDSPEPIKIPDLQTVVQLRMSEIFEIIRHRLEEQNRLHLLGDGVVLTGGGALLRNLVPLARKVFGLPCDVGIPNAPELLLPLELLSPLWSSAVGALRIARLEALERASQPGPLRRLFNWFFLRDD